MRADLFGSLRPWQKAAYQEYFRLPRRDFLLVATPGAGKTAFALTIAADLLARREVAAVTVVTPTEHLKHQWSQAAHRVGIALDPAYRNSQGAGLGRLRRRGGDLRPGGRAPGAAPAAHHQPPHAGDLR